MFWPQSSGYFGSVIYLTLLSRSQVDSGGTEEGAAGCRRATMRCGDPNCPARWCLADMAWLSGRARPWPHFPADDQPNSGGNVTSRTIRTLGALGLPKERAVAQFG